MKKEEGVTALREVGMSHIEIQQLIQMETLRRSNHEKEQKKLKAVEIVRSMEL